MDTSGDDPQFIKWFTELLEWLGSYLSTRRIPPVLLAKITREVEVLKGFLDTRPARFLIVGRRGAGKSTFINAIFGEDVASVGHVDVGTTFAKWYAYESTRGSIEILDTRGLGEGGSAGPQASGVALDQAEAEIARTLPDVVVFLCKAKEVAARIDEDLSDLKTIVELVKEHHTYEPPVIGVATQVDELDPPHVSEPPFDHETKRRNIEAATRLLSERLHSVTGSVIDVCPVCAYMAFGDAGSVEHDRRWNIDKLLELLVEKVPQSAQLSLARIAHIKSVQRKVARAITGAAAAIAGGVALEPIPVADLPVITGIQVGMVVGIAYVSGRKLDKRAAAEFLTAMGANVGAAFALRELARALVKLWAGPGNAISAAIAAAATWAIGEAAIAYFIEGASKERARKVFEERRRQQAE